MRRAALQQHLGEATGGGADVEAFAIAWVDLEMIECCNQFQGRARHIILRRIADLEDDISGKCQAGFGDDLAIDAHGAARNRVARTGAAGEQAARYQKLVQPVIFR